MEKLEVKYLGIIVGYTYDGKAIEFLDNEQSRELKKFLDEGHPIGISSRRTGTVENGRVNYEKVTEYSVVKILNDNDKN